MSPHSDTPVGWPLRAALRRLVAPEFGPIELQLNEREASGGLRERFASLFTILWGEVGAGVRDGRLLATGFPAGSRRARAEIIDPSFVIDATPDFTESSLTLEGMTYKRVRLYAKPWPVDLTAAIAPSASASMRAVAPNKASARRRPREDDLKAQLLTYARKWSDEHHGEPLPKPEAVAACVKWNASTRSADAAYRGLPRDLRYGKGQKRRSAKISPTDD